MTSYEMLRIFCSHVNKLFSSSYEEVFSCEHERGFKLILLKSEFIHTEKKIERPSFLLLKSFYEIE